MTDTADLIDALDKVIACEGHTPGDWRAGLGDMMSYDASGTVAFKNIYVDDPRGGVHPLGEALPLTVAKAVDESALFYGATALSDEEVHANARFIAASANLASHAPALKAALEENARMREALKPFAKAADIKLCGEWRDDQSIQPTDTAFSITFGHLRAARRALGDQPND